MCVQSIKVEDVQPSSISISWDPPDTGPYPIYSYKVSVRNLHQQGGEGFKVVIEDTQSDVPCATIIGLAPDTAYDVHIAALSAQSMAVQGAPLRRRSFKLRQRSTLRLGSSTKRRMTGPGRSMKGMERKPVRKWKRISAQRLFQRPCLPRASAEQVFGAFK